METVRAFETPNGDSKAVTTEHQIHLFRGTTKKVEVGEHNAAVA